MRGQKHQQWIQRKHIESKRKSRYSGFEVLDHVAGVLAGFPADQVIGFAEQGNGVVVYLYEHRAREMFFASASMEETLIQCSERPIDQRFKKVAKAVYLRPEFVKSEDAQGRWVQLCTDVVVSLDESVRSAIPA